MQLFMTVIDPAAEPPVSRDVLVEASTGTTLLELARLLDGRGFRFIGLDNAPAMLAKARRKTAMFGKSGQISFHVEDITSCALPPAELAARWRDSAWPSARVHSALLASLPAGAFPGVDQTEVMEFLERQ